MQTSHLLLHILLVLLLTATVSLRSNAEDLLDIDGDIIQPGLEYYMVSSMRGAGGGGVVPTKLGPSSCPSYVGWARSDLDKGVPVIINSVNRRDATSIELQERVYIQFTKVAECVKTPYWTTTRGRGLVATGGSKPEVPPPTGTSNNMFSFWIDRRLSAYGFSYCPCNQCRLPCSDVGRATANGQRILAIRSYNEFTVVFIKA